MKHIRTLGIAVATATAAAAPLLTTSPDHSTHHYASGTGADAMTAATGQVSPVALPGLAGAAAPSYKLSYSQLFSGKWVVNRWNPCTPIPYLVNLAAVPTAKRAAALSLTMYSVARLSSATGMTFTYRGGTAFVPKIGNIDKQPAKVVIAWTTPTKTDLPLSGSTLGRGGFYARGWSWSADDGGKVEGNAIMRGMVVLDTPQLLKSYPLKFGKGNVSGNVVLHELGHVVGLQHVTVGTQQMYPTLRAASPDGYAAGDRAGLARVGRGAGCIAVPPGFE